MPATSPYRHEPVAGIGPSTNPPCHPGPSATTKLAGGLTTAPPCVLDGCGPGSVCGPAPPGPPPLAGAGAAPVQELNSSPSVNTTSTSRVLVASLNHALRILDLGGVSGWCRSGSGWSGQDVCRGDVPADQCTRGTQVPGVGAGRTFWCGGSGGVPPLDDESMPSTDVDDGHLVPCLPDAALLDAQVRAKRPQSREQVAFVVMTFRRRLGWAPGFSGERTATLGAAS